MGDLVLRVSVLVQQGYMCQCCGAELSGDPAGKPVSCTACRSSAGGGDVGDHG